MPFDLRNSDDPLDDDAKLMLMEMAGIKLDYSNVGMCKIEWKNTAYIVPANERGEHLSNAFDIYVWMQKKGLPR